MMGSCRHLRVRQLLCAICVVIVTSSPHATGHSLAKRVAVRGDQPPPPPQPGAIVASLSTSSHIQVIRTKPRVVNRVYTSLNNVTADHQSIRIDWSVLYVADENSYHRRRRRNHRSITDIKRLQWSITLREFANYTTLRESVRDEISLTNTTTHYNKTYSLTFSDLKPNFAYELCISSPESSIADEVLSLYSTRRPDCLERRLNSHILCKELRTRRPLYNTQVAIATAVSSASTLIIVLLVCCCCPRRNSQKNKRPRDKERYQRFSKSSSSSDAASSDMQSTCYRPQVRSKSQDYYINPADLMSISGRNLRVFVRESRRLYIPSKWTTKRQSNLSDCDNARPKRPKSWSPADVTQQQWPSLNGSSVDSASSASIL